MNVEYLPLSWKNNRLEVLDQRLLPTEEKYVCIENLNDCCEAISQMVVRGAPLIGFTAIWGMGIWCQKEAQNEKDIDVIAERLKSCRPTAVNLMYEVDRTVRLIKGELKEGKTFHETAKIVFDFAEFEMHQLYLRNKKMAEDVHRFLNDRTGKRSFNILTLCNTGALACGPMGTALGVISHLHGQGALDQAWLCETRPYLQGSRLSSFELAKEEVPHRILVEGASSYLMRRGLVDAVCIGADRIVENGDTANKVGSSMLAILAKHYKIPFIVVAPSSSFDMDKKSGEEIEVEFREEREVLQFRDQVIAPEGSQAWNPSFDITSSEEISAISCELGIISPVTRSNVIKVFEKGRT